MEPNDQQRNNDTIEIPDDDYDDMMETVATLSKSPNQTNRMIQQNNHMTKPAQKDNN